MSFITSDQFRQIVNGYQSTDIADVYASILKKTFLRHDQHLYKVNLDSMTLRKLDMKINDVLLNEIANLICTSEKELTDDQLIILRSKEYSGYKSLSDPRSIARILPMVDQRLHGSVSEGLPHEIHFKNGYINVKTTDFEKRTKFVLNYIDRDYTPSTNSDRASIKLILAKIYPSIKERLYILNTLGSAFSGQVKKDRTSLFLLGKSSAGKSLLMQMIQAGFSDIYVREFASNTFAKSNPNRNKIMNQFLKSSQIRITWVNELLGKIDDSLFKSFCEGSVITTQLYKDGTDVIPHHSKVVLTSNEMPNIKMDTGIASRIVSYHHVSHFTDD